MQLFLVFLLLPLGLGFQTTTQAASSVSIYIDGNYQSYSTLAKVEKGRTMVPFRGIFEALEASVQYNPSTQTIDAKRGTTHIWLKTGSTAAKVNGQPVTLDAPAKIVNGRTIVPLRFIAESLKAKVEWDAVNQSVYISSDATQPQRPIQDEYSTARITSGEIVFSGQKYSTYQQARAAMTSQDIGIGFKRVVTNSKNERVFQAERLIYTKGEAVGYSPFNGDTTIIYDSPQFRKQLTYTQAGREMRILEQHEHYYKVQVADTVGYTKRVQTGIVPRTLVPHREHYRINTNQALVHSYYDHLKKRVESYEVGPAPTQLKVGVTYYSMDGIRFYADPNFQQLVTTHYPYFQYLNIRSQSNYSAQELEQMITNELTRIASTSNPNALRDSKLVGLGEHIKQMETEHHVNALFILSAAIHESAYGLSSNAKSINNLFGIRVTDQNTAGGTRFAHPKDSVTAFVLDYMNKNYARPGGLYAKGASPGNKTMGANVHYASDPTWGAKIASHMWRLDQKMGKKDINQERRGVITSAIGTNIRQKPSTSEPVLFRFNEKYMGVSGKSGYPVIVVSEQKQADGYVWYEIIADAVDQPQATGWVRGDLIEIID